MIIFFQYLVKKIDPYLENLGIWYHCYKSSISPLFCSLRGMVQFTAEYHAHKGLSTEVSISSVWHGKWCDLYEVESNGKKLSHLSGAPEGRISWAQPLLPHCFLPKHSDGKSWTIFSTVGSCLGALCCHRPKSTMSNNHRLKVWVKKTFFFH